MNAVRAVDEPHLCCELCTVRSRYVRRLADEMGLRDWIIEVAHDPPRRANVRAQVELASERKLLIVSFMENHEKLDAEDRRHDVVHELVHPLLRDLYETVMQAAQQEFGAAAYRLFTTQVSREKEQAVDAIASVIAPHMPLPEW